MVITVVHLETGVTDVKNNAEQVLEFEDRFELVDKRKNGAPQTSASYHRSRFRFDTILRSKSYHLWASFPPWRCFIPVNVALLRLPPFSLARAKNPSQI